ncbi:MAG TPA: MlaD family protein [Burkholderiales bacterium]|jgi:phospholipid/cholesterol/gamma-HCH transport system substrate-binding protein|nr:MlaD family protein [Burkholderiales bacterium]
METKVNYVAVGLFTLVLSAALIAGLLWLAAGGHFGKQYETYLAYVNESVAGLNLNAPVKYRGVDVGRVSDIRLDPVNSESVKLTFQITKGTPVKTDTTAVLKSQGLTGIAYVELDGGSKEAPLLVSGAGADYPVIQTKPSLAARLENVATQVLSNLDRTSNNLNALLSDENRAALQRTLADISTITHTIAARKDNIDSTLANADKLFEQGNRAMAEVGPAIQRIDRSAEAIRKMAENASAASVEAGNTVHAVGGDVKRLTSETLPEFERLMREMDDLASSLRRLSDNFERNPNSLLFGRAPPKKGPGE